MYLLVYNGIFVCIALLWMFFCPRRLYRLSFNNEPPQILGAKYLMRSPTVSPSDCLMSYLGHLLEKSYPSAEILYGAAEDFVVGYWYLTPLVSSYSILICWASSCQWKLERKKKEGRKEAREDIFSILTLFHLGFSRDCSVAKNVFLDYLRTVFLPNQALKYISHPR